MVACIVFQSTAAAQVSSVELIPSNGIRFPLLSNISSNKHVSVESTVDTRSDLCTMIG